MIDCYFINISNAAKIQKNSECSVQKAELFEDYGGYGVFGAPSRAHQTANKRPQGTFYKSPGSLCKLLQTTHTINGGSWLLLFILYEEIN